MAGRELDTLPPVIAALVRLLVREAGVSEEAWLASLRIEARRAGRPS
jgi:hypothetical protein